MKSAAVKIVMLAAMLGALTATSDAKRTKPQPDPRFVPIDVITVLPVVDARPGKKDNVNLESLRKSAVFNLKHKHYSLKTSDDAGTVGEIAEEDLNEGRTAWIKRLGPADARWILVLGLDEVHSKFTFGSTGNAEVTGVLFDKQEGTVVWRGTGVGQAGQGGLAGMAFKGMMKGMALDEAVGNLLAAIPKKNK